MTLQLHNFHVAQIPTPSRSCIIFLAFAPYLNQPQTPNPDYRIPRYSSGLKMTSSNTRAPLSSMLIILYSTPRNIHLPRTPTTTALPTPTSTKNTITLFRIRNASSISAFIILRCLVCQCHGSSLPCTFPFPFPPPLSLFASGDLT